MLSASLGKEHLKRLIGSRKFRWIKPMIDVRFSSPTINPTAFCNTAHFTRRFDCWKILVPLVCPTAPYVKPTQNNKWYKRQVLVARLDLDSRLNYKEKSSYTRIAFKENHSKQFLILHLCQYLYISRILVSTSNVSGLYVFFRRLFCSIWNPSWEKDPWHRLQKISDEVKNHWVDSRKDFSWSETSLSSQKFIKGKRKTLKWFAIWMANCQLRQDTFIP